MRSTIERNFRKITGELQIIVEIMGLWNLTSTTTQQWKGQILLKHKDTQPN